MLFFSSYQCLLIQLLIIPFVSHATCNSSHYRHADYHKRATTSFKTLPRFQLEISSQGQFNGLFLTAYISSIYISTSSSSSGFASNCEGHIVDAAGKVIWYLPPTTWNGQLIRMEHYSPPPRGYVALSSTLDGNNMLTEASVYAFKFAICTDGHLYISKGDVNYGNCEAIQLQATTLSSSSDSTSSSSPTSNAGTVFIDGNFESDDFPWTVTIYGNVTGYVTTNRPHTGRKSFEVTIPDSQISHLGDGTSNDKRSLVRRKGLSTGTDKLTLAQYAKSKRKRQLEPFDKRAQSPNAFQLSFWYYITEVADTCSLYVTYDSLDTEQYSVLANTANVGSWKQANTRFYVPDDDINLQFNFQCDPPIPSSTMKMFLDDVVGYYTYIPTSTATSSTPLGQTSPPSVQTVVVTRTVTPSVQTYTATSSPQVVTVTSTQT